MSPLFRVRFAASGELSYSPNGSNNEQPKVLDRPNQRRKSRFGCLECKTRHVKCDETFPVCLRCRQRGATCRSAVRSAQWQLETPGLTIHGNLSTIPANVNHRLLQYWVEKASQIMVLDPDINPFSFGVLKYLETSQSLVHSVQSLSVAHENFFSSTSLLSCLEERAQALSLVRKELQESTRPMPGSLLSILILGISSSMVFHQTGDDFGQAHFRGAKAVLEILLAEPDSEQDSLLRMAIASYLVWDQATAFLPQTQGESLDWSVDFHRCVEVMRNEYSPIIGYSIDIINLLGNLGRYCRAVLDGSPQDLDEEAGFEEQLLNGTHRGSDYNAYLVDECFRKHGLIMLYRTIELVTPKVSLEFFEDCSMTTTEECSPYHDLVRQNVEDILQNIAQLPDDCQYHRFVPQPLLAAGSELGPCDSAQRENVREHFRKIYSLTRMPAHLHAIEFLDEMWTMQDSGQKVFWMSYLSQRDRKFIVF